MPTPNRPQYSTKLLRQVRTDIGRTIHEARVREKMTLEKLSKLTDIPVWKLDWYELGKGEIRLEEILKLIYVLN